MLVPLKLVRDQPLQQQLYEQLAGLIESARLPYGTRMPSTRMLAEQFSISRITVLLTYERLIAEGYLRTKPAKGTFVNLTSRPAPTPQGAARSRDVSQAVPHTAGQPDPKLFPTGRWRALVRQALNSLGVSLSEDHTDGDPALRRAVARWLSMSRGIPVEPDQVILANDPHHALHIAAHMLLGASATAVTAGPGEHATDSIIGSAGAALLRVPVDAHGIQVDALPRNGAALVLVTPDNQPPLGSVMTLSRRHALLAWAAKTGSVVVEADFQGDLRYEAADAAALMSLDRHDTVIHAGGFAATLGPGTLRSYLAVPRRLVAPAREAGRLTGSYTGLLEGAALARLLENGGYARHLHQIRKTYMARRNELVLSLRRRFGEAAAIQVAATGLHMAWTLPPHMPPAPTVAALGRRAGLDTSAVNNAVVLVGFGTPAEREMEISVTRLQAALRNAQDALAHPTAQSAD